VALAWHFLLQPALSVWQHHANERAVLEQQRQQMAGLQAQAQALQKRTPLSREEALKSLQALTRSAMPSAQVAAQNERVSVSFKAASATVVASWLQSARENAQVRVVDAQWQRTPEGLWEGSMVLKLPTRNGSP
jgi:type II secretory pathway component PulM